MKQDADHELHRGNQQPTAKVEGGILKGGKPKVSPLDQDRGAQI